MIGKSETMYRVEYRRFGIWRGMKVFETEDEAYGFIQDMEYFDVKDGLPFVRYRIRRVKGRPGRTRTAWWCGTSRRTVPTRSLSHLFQREGQLRDHPPVLLRRDGGRLLALLRRVRHDPHHRRRGRPGRRCGRCRSRPEEEEGLKPEAGRVRPSRRNPLPALFLITTLIVPDMASDTARDRNAARL